MIDLIVHGAAGRMGRRIIELALEAPAHLRVFAGVDKSGPETLRGLGLASDAPLLKSLPVRPGAVLIDFSHASAAAGVAAHCAANGMGLVLGSTGITPADLENILSSTSTQVAVLQAANYSLGVNVLLAHAARLARELGPDYDIEIIEAHHHHKVDAPSGTALALADSILAATGRTRADLVHGREGHVGARKKGEIGMHALRMGDVVGDHQVYFVGNGERILLGHVAHSRDVFARGALRAAQWLSGKPAGRYGMGHVLGLV